MCDSRSSEVRSDSSELKPEIPAHMSMFGLGLQAIKMKSMVVPEELERDLACVDEDVNATPTQLLVRKAMVAQRYLPMAFPELMYS